jgi:hypothetical protein
MPAVLRIILCALTLGSGITWCHSSADIAPPGFDRDKIDRHQQLFDFSCIPSGVEMILKLIGRVPENYYALQESWGNKTDGSFGDFDQRTIAGVRFRRRFGVPRGPKFPLKKLFAAIDAELKHGRYVLASLSSGGADYHMWVIVQRLDDGRYRALSKNGRETIEIKDTRERIQAMQGTDIATYTISGSLP